ncbi:MAG TPA: hypothetical protein ENK31_01765 [Nannocystis exedens]|nr:hypothetical protein [Nannocystis exedens]
MDRLAALRRLAPIQMSDLEGCWHIQLTNFPMWLTGKKLGPTLNYGESMDDGRFTDTVRFRTNYGKERLIQGFDAQDIDNRAHFRWRGKGLLSLLSSDWYVVHLDKNVGLMAIYFTKTLFTPEGMDIASRSARPEEAQIREFLSALKTMPEFGSMVSTLVPVSD